MSNYSGNVLGDQFRFVAGQTSPEDALSDAKYPASGSFVDLAGVERVHVFIHTGAQADEITFQLESADADDGTPADISGAVAVAAATDADQIFTITVETAALLKNGAAHQFLTCDVSGNSGSNYAEIVFMLEGEELPVTQASALMPSGNVVYVNS